MIMSEDPFKSPPIEKGRSEKQQSSSIDGENRREREGLFTPRFKSVAEMAGWDEESLLISSLVVEDTPDREPNHKRPSNLVHFRTPPSNSRRKRMVQRKSPVLIRATTLNLDEDEVPNYGTFINKSLSNSRRKRMVQRKGPVLIPTLDLDEDDIPKNDVGKQDKELIKPESGKEKKLKNVIEVESNGKGRSVDHSTSPAIPCIDKLREELSCAICLEICYEPCTTPCGHSFCSKCLRSAADKCGKKCPKCRQLISNGRSCTVNTVLWNTIQLLFPQEIEARKVSATAAAAGALKKRDSSHRTSVRVSHYNARNGSILALNSPTSEERIPGRRRGIDSTRSRTFQPSAASISGVAGISNPTMSRRRRDLVPNQDEDAALALRLQREEFMEAFRGRGEEGSSVTLARANLRAMASRAMDNQIRRSRESR